MKVFRRGGAVRFQPFCWCILGSRIQQQDADKQKRRARDGARRYRLGGDEAEQQDLQNRYGDHQRISDAELDACRSQRIEGKACPICADFGQPKRQRATGETQYQHVGLSSDYFPGPT